MNYGIIIAAFIALTLAATNPPIDEHKARIKQMFKVNDMEVFLSRDY